MAAPPTPAGPCPVCTAPLVELQLGRQLVLRSCSRCDHRWWFRAEHPTDLDDVLGVVGAPVPRAGGASL